VVPALLTAALAASIAQTIVISALPVFGRDLGVVAPVAAWLLTSFMLASAVATPIVGRLGDLFGYRRVLLACLGCFVVGSAVAAAGASLDSVGPLLAGRVLQGVSGGVFPLAFGIARHTLPPARLGGAIAILSAMFGLGGAAGMVVAGPLVDLAGTASLFWLTLALGAAALASGALLPPGPATPSAGGRLDPGGALLLSAGLVGVLLAISQGAAWGWGSARTVLLALGSVAALAATTNLATLVISVAMFGAVTLIPRFVQTPISAGYGFGASTTRAGLVLIPVAALMLVAGPAAAPLSRRFGPRLPLRLGTVFAAAAFVTLAARHDSVWQITVAGILLGIGYGLSFASLGGLVVDAVTPSQTGIATAVNTIVRTVGGAVGAQTAAAILATDATAPVPPASAYTTAFVVFGVLAVAALAVTFSIPRPDVTAPRMQPATAEDTVPTA